jgi:bacillopeptidase F
MKNLFYQCAVILSFCLVISACPVPAAQAAEVDDRLQAILADPAVVEAIPVIVTFRDGVDFSRLPAGPRSQRRAALVGALKSRAAEAKTEARGFLRQRGVGAIKDLWIINGLALTATPETIRALMRERPEVLSIRYDEVISLSVPEISTSQVTGPVEPNIEQVRAPQLWQQGFKGQGVTVAIMDSGVDLNHPDLKLRWRGGSNSWFDPNGEHPDLPVDVDGHGTGMMGVMVGGNTGGSSIGVAPAAQWIAVKIFNDAGNASASDIHQGFAWLLDPDGNPATDDAPDLVNNSWGSDQTTGKCDSFDRVFQSDLQALKAAGIAVIFAAGNTGPGTNTSIAPANYPEAFAVGSLGTHRSKTTISDFSARGPSACDGTVYPEVVTPGYNVQTADLMPEGTSDGTYVRMSGTSLSAPHVSGVMALLLSAFPETRVEALEAVLKESATDLGAAGADNSYGYGLVNAETAFNLLNDAILGIANPVDGSLLFGHLPVGGIETNIVTLQNDGGEYLFIQSASIAGSPSAFAISSNTCTQILRPGDTCTIAVRFAPLTHQSFTARLDVFSNGSASGVTSIELAGLGNSSPPAPQPMTPADGMTGLAATVVLQWDQLPDVDGDAVAHEVLFSKSPDFSQSTPIEVIFLAPVGGALLVGLGGFFAFFGVATDNGKRKKQLVTGLLLASALMLLLSCGGGGGGGGDGGVVGAGGAGGVGAGGTEDNGGSLAAELMVEPNSLQLTDLDPATTYYWKVAGEDEFGGRTESVVQSFTTR